MKGIINGLYLFTGMIGFPSYALAIILMAIIIKVILYPLTVKQMKSTMGMQDIQPKMQEIQKKYKNNPEKMNQEVMALYQEYEINPMAGCLPLIIQMPILYGLFAAMRSFEYVNTADAGFFWVANISDPDPLHLLPIIVGVAMFLQQKFMMPATQPGGGNDQMNQMMKVMLYVMPVMIGFMALTLPSGLAIYWAMFSILGMVQQIFINRRRKKEQEIRAKKEEERKAEMERKKEEQRKMGQAPSKKKKKKPQPKAEYIPPAKKEGPDKE